MPVKYADIVHPDYLSCAPDWRKWRLTFEGGDAYIDEYLRKFNREKWPNWFERRFLTYCPPAAKEAVVEVRNAVFQRLNDVSRTAGTGTYMASCKGEDGGVDRKGATMSSFLGLTVLDEMLSMKEVGVWIDMPIIRPGETLKDSEKKKPYLYYFPVESVLSWREDDSGKLIRLLVKECELSYDETTGLPTGTEQDRYRFAWLGLDGKVHVRIEDKDGVEIQAETVLDIDEIPFTWFFIPHSLLQDVADMQKALLNMESSDVYWCVKSNWPVFVEQYDPRPSSAMARPAQQAAKVPTFNEDPLVTFSAQETPSGQAKEAGQGKDVERTLGPTGGFRYGKDLNAPAFIHPSPEPLEASMKKEQQIEEKIRRSIHLSVAMLDPRMASAESKQMDDKGLQNGLLAIGMALEAGERDVARIWAKYEKATPTTIRYPEEWTMQGDAGRRADAEALCKLKDQVPSITASKEICKEVANKLLGHKIAPAKLEEIYNQIDQAECLTFKIEDVEKEIQLRIASAETVSKNRGYPKTEHEKALKEQAEQLRIVAISQTDGAAAAADPARGGVGDPADEGSRQEKALDANKTGVPQDNTRGGGK